MRAATVVGIVLIILGALGLIYEGITYTRRETAVQVGPLEAEVEERETIPVPAWLSVLALVGGIALVVVDRRRA